MSSRLQRWGERALGHVRSVSPRISSRFEPEKSAGPLDEHAGFQEIEVETPVRRQPRPILPSERVEMIAPISPQPEIIEEKPERVRVVREAASPPAHVEPPPPPPKASEPPISPTIVVQAAPVREAPERSPRPEAPPKESKSSRTPEPTPSGITTETSFTRWKSFEEWLATPPREKARTAEPSTPLPKPVPDTVTLQSEAHPALPIEISPLPRAEPPQAAPAPIVVSIGTIIVRANPPAAPKPVAPPPADGLAAFLARRTAGQP